MVRSVNTGSIRLVDPNESKNPFSLPSTIDLGPNNGDINTTMQDGAAKIENPDGSLTIDFAPKTAKQSKGDWDANLALEIDPAELSRIATELLDGINMDDLSRKDWLDTRARGIGLLGLKLSEPKAEANAEGVSTVQHPLLLEATLRFQANARGELLPAAGPLKIRNDAPMPPKLPDPPPMPPMPPQMGHNGGPPMSGNGAGGSPINPSAAPGGGTPPSPPVTPPSSPAGASGGPPPPPAGASGPPAPPSPAPPPPTGMMAPPKPVLPGGMTNASDELAEALETDMNHWLTAVATEYYPDTDRMLFWVGCGGQGIKKVYNCPLRRRPVSESIDAEDLIVSNAETNLENCGRITHRIKMRPSVLKRMQLVGAYRDVDLPTNQLMLPDPVKEKKLEIQGITPHPTQRPQDTDYEIYECYCELDIEGFEHKEKGKITGLQLPYIVTIHKDSREILALRRNWRKDDKMCMAKEYFVDFPFVRALGFYGIGLIHILGNTTSALTAAWRIQLDAGMFSSFPGFIYAKQFGRQLTNQFRVPPGGGVPIDTGGLPITQAIMPLPYKEPGSAFMQLTQNIEQLGQRLGGTAEMNIGEGKQDAPVGTTLALIEQATKTMDAVHKRLTAAQGKEFMLLKERFKEDPESFWRHNKTKFAWQKAQFLMALEDNKLVPVADPNNPTSMHRIAKAVVIKTLQQGAPDLYDPIAVDTRIMRIAGIDPEGLFRPTPAPPPPDPSLIAAQAKQQANQQMAQSQQLQMMIKLKIAQLQSQDKAQDRTSREKAEQLKIMLERLKIQEESIIHKSESQHDMQLEAMKLLMDHHRAQAETQNDIALKQHQTAADMQMEQQRQISDQHLKTGGMVADAVRDHAAHQQEMALERDKHERELAHKHALAQQDLEHKHAMAQHELDHKERLAKIDGDNKIRVAKASAKFKPKPKPAGKK
jgi:hypothetical protein